MKSKQLAIALSLAAATGHGQPVQGPFGSVAGGELTLTIGPEVDQIFGQVGPTPVSCKLAADRKTATCDIPTRLGPGLWPAEIDLRMGDQRTTSRAIVELRVPMILAVEPRVSKPGAGYERALEPQLVRATRLRVRLPNTQLPPNPLLQLRVRDLESEPFAGLVVNRWLSLAMTWLEYVVPGPVVGGAVALAVIVFRPKHERVR